MSETLKPCPFCGGKAELYVYVINGDKRIRCSHCGCSTSGYGEPEYAVTAWNRRTDEWRPASETPLIERWYFVSDGKETGFAVTYPNRGWCALSFDPKDMIELGDRITHWMPLPEPPRG